MCHSRLAQRTPGSHPCDALSGEGCGRKSGFVDRPDDEDRAVAESLRRGSEVEDQLADDAAPPRVSIVQFLRGATERPPSGHDVDRRVVQEIAGPVLVGPSGGDEDRPVGLGDEPDRDRPPFAAPPAACPETREPIVVGQGVVDLGLALGVGRRLGVGAWNERAGVGLRVRIVGGRQRPRCQDLPSVATDGA